MDLQENGEPVYQYYTIVNDSIEEPDEHNKSIIYLTFDQNDGEDDEPMVSVADDVQDDEAADVSDIKVITFSDGEIYVTNTAPDELSGEKSDVTARNSVESLENVELEGEEKSNSEEPSDNLGSDYQQIKLEDGTCAIIDKKLWNSIVESATSKAPENPKKNKKFPCMYIGCDKVYSTAHHLTVHIRNHTGCRPYRCTIEGCDKAFSTGYSLKAHLRTHTGEKPYACNSCIKQFKTSGDLQKHVRTHTGEKPFKCPIDGCGRSFTTSNIRKVHIRSHTGERPYVCEKINCGKAFSSATNYKNHMRIHSGEKPYVCTVTGCDKRFTEYSSLYKHNMVHKPSKPFKCNYCGQTCKQDSTLKAHKRSIHNIIITEDGTEIIVKKEDQFAEVILEISEQTEAEFIDTSEY